MLLEQSPRNFRLKLEAYFLRLRSVSSITYFNVSHASSTFALHRPSIMRLYSIQALKVLTFLLTTTSAVPANNDIEAESDLATRGIHCTTDCWSDGYGEVGVGNFSFILDYQHHCTVTLKTQEYPSAGRVYSLNSNGTIACCKSKPPTLLRAHNSPIPPVASHRD